MLKLKITGARATGAGPEADQRGEHLRADDQHLHGQSVDDQHVEAHLADCPSCRNRLLDFHRAHFALLAEPGVSKPGVSEPRVSAPDVSQALLADLGSTDLKAGDAKPAESKLTAPRHPADPLLRTTSTPECPSNDDLRQLAAGLTPDAIATKLTQHTATCDHCGPLLKTYTEDFSDDFSPEEQAALAKLQSSSEGWQKALAKKMASFQQPDSKKDR